MPKPLGTAGVSRFAALTALMLCQAAAAWESLPLREPALARSVFAGAAVLYVCGDDSVRTSGDGGETWHAISSIPGSGSVTAAWARQASLKDPVWTTVPAPPADTVLTLAAADSVLYAAEAGKLWIRTDRDAWGKRADPDRPLPVRPNE